MTEINILPPYIYNLLAAGEVVESPASIVKEAVENSLDAEAKYIEVSIKNGGLTEILITDNGLGCPENQIDKVFMPHATSKILNAKDIENIGTLGFRGEALSSISSVAQTEFISRTKSQDLASRLELHGGETIAKGKVAANVGTRLAVRNLFYNVPARKKFLKKPTTETNNVTNIVQKLILANPAISFKYTIDNEIVYDYKGKNLADAIKLIYGSETAEKILPIRYSSQGMALEGFISAPAFKKHNRTWQTVMVNNRTVESGTVAAAANAAFSNYMISGNFPFFVLNLKVDLSIVDVNVHPRKSEVKFSNDTQIFDFVRTAVTACIDNHQQQDTAMLQSAAPNIAPLHPSLQRAASDETISSPTSNEEKDNTKRRQSSQEASNDEALTQLIHDDANDKQQLFAVKFLSSTKSNETAVRSAPNVLSLLSKMETFENQVAELKKKPLQVEEPSVRRDGFDTRIVGTVFDCYILITHNKELLILDQHAAHERLLYDELQQQIDSGKVITQQLLEPSILYLTPQEMTRMTDAAPHLNKMGVCCEQFGNNCFRITAVPISVLPHGIDTVIANLLHEVKSAPPSRLSELIKDRLIMDCCKNAIKAGQHLSQEQIHAFLRQFQETNIVPACPHGRPIFVKLTQPQIEKMFSRK